MFPLMFPWPVLICFRLYDYRDQEQNKNGYWPNHVLCMLVICPSSPPKSKFMNFSGNVEMSNESSWASTSSLAHHVVSALWSTTIARMLKMLFATSMVPDWMIELFEQTGTQVL